MEVGFGFMVREQINYSNNRIVTSFLAHRGFSVKAVDYLLDLNSEHQHDPFLLRGVDEWIDILYSLKGSRIAIMPDFDADGVLSGTLLRVGLYLFGFGDTYIYPPEVFDGYGLTPKSVDNILRAQPDTTVIITTDNGSNAYEGVEYAKGLGIDVLVTDHHISDEDTAALATVNPNRRFDIEGELYPFKSISGTAVIYKTLLAYGLKYITDPQKMFDFKSLVFLVGVSTISDVMPVLDENRYYVKEAVAMLGRFNDSMYDGRIMRYDNTPLGQYYRGVEMLVITLNAHDRFRHGINVDTFGFVIGPILNSPRRMTGKSKLAFDLFRTDRDRLLDDDYRSVSDELYAINEQRKLYMGEYIGALYQRVDDDMSKGVDPVHYAVFNSVVNAGISGLLAGQYTNKYNLPSVSFSVQPEHNVVMSADIKDLINVPTDGDFMMSGSARAPEYFNLYEFLTKIDEDYPELITSWGGHSQAAGVKIHASKFDMFRSVFVGRLVQVLRDIEGKDGRSKQELPLYSEFVITTHAYEELSKTRPVPSDVHEIVIGNNTAIHRNRELFEALVFFEALEPYGNSFTEPTFSVIFRMSDVTTFRMGDAKQHIKFTLPNNLSIINWHGSHSFDLEDDSNKVYVAIGSLGINDFRGNKTFQLIAREITAL